MSDRKSLIYHNLDKYLAILVIKYDYMFQGIKVMDLKGHTDRIVAIDKTSSGKIVTASTKEVIIWDFESSTSEIIFSGIHIKDIRVLRDGKVAILRGFRVTIWNPETHILTQSDIVTLRMEILPSSKDDDKIISGQPVRDETNTSIQIWDPNFKQYKVELRGHTKNVNVLVPLQGKIISGSMDNSIKIWNVKTQECETTFLGHTGYIEALAILPSSEGNKIVSSSKDKTIRIWNSANGECEMIIPGYTSNISISQDKKIIGLSSRNGFIKIWDSKTGVLEFESEERLRACAILPDGNIIGIGADGISKIIDPETQTQKDIVMDDNILFTKILAGRVITASKDGTVTIWE